MRLFIALIAVAMLMIPAFVYGQAPDPWQIAHVRSEYTLANGKKVIIEESGDAWRAEKAAASPVKSPAAARCTTCGNACDCGPGCACEEAKAKLAAAKATAPRKYYLPAAEPEPAPVVYSGLPAWTPTAGGYYQGGYYQPMPATIQGAPQMTYYSSPTYTAGPSYAAPVYGQPVYGGACAGGNCSAAPGGQATTRGFSMTGPFGGGFRYGAATASGK